MVLTVAVGFAGTGLLAHHLLTRNDADDRGAVPARFDETPPTQALRDQLLRSSWAELGIRPRPSGVWGVLMELGFAKGVATVVGLADGTASLYLTSGGGVLGAGARESVRRAAMALCDAAASALAKASPAATVPGASPAHPYPQPAAGHVRFYLLTVAGLRVADGEEAKLRGGKDPLSPLYDSGQGVITALREASGGAAAR